MGRTALHRIGINKKLDCGDTVVLNSHFDLFPVGKYRDYCDLHRFTVEVDCDGKVSSEILVYREDCTETVLKSDSFGDDGILAGFRITALKDCFVKSLCVACEEEPKEVNLALCICTYKLYDDVKKKVKAVKGLAEIYITDNGSALGEINGAHEFPSPNYGGSTGFTNAMVEASKNEKITHFILNDDDASFDPEVLFRTKAFLGFCKKDVCICGTMIDADDRHTVVESGARFEGCELYPYDANLDTDLLESNILMERKKDIHYGGWWYFVLSRETFEEAGLPLPLFIKMDDVEYGCRIKKEKITLCGISAFHKRFTAKYSPVNSYYYMRNLLTVGCITGRIGRHDLKKVIEKVYVEIVCYRYLDAEMMIKGIEDFIKGPEYVLGLYKNGMIECEMPELIPLDSFECEECVKPAGFLFRKLTLNGALLPSRGKIVRNVWDNHTEDFYRLKEVCFIIGEKGLVMKKDVKKILLFCSETKKIHFKLNDKTLIALYNKIDQ